MSERATGTGLDYAADVFGETGPRLEPWLGQRLWVSLLAAILILLVVPPVIYLVLTSVYTTDARGAFATLTLQHYADTISNPRLISNFVNTAIFATGSAVVAILVSVLLGWIVERTNTPMRGSVLLVSIVSLGTPNILYTIAWLLILGKAGPVNQTLASTLGPDYAINVYSMWGMILIEGLSWIPLAFLMISSVMRSSDPSLEEAAIMSGGSTLQTFRRITLQLALPGIAALALLIFTRTFESFEVAAIVGVPGRISVMTTDIYQAARLSAPPKFGQSAAFAVVLLIVVAFLLLWYNQLARNAHRYQTITGKGYRPRTIDLGPWRYATAAILIAFVTLIVILPIAIITWTSFVRFYDGINLAALARMTTRNFDLVYRSGSFHDSILNTVVIAAFAATSVTLLAAGCAWLVVRRVPGAWLLDQLASMPIVFPAIVLGMAFLQIFLNTPFGLYGTLASLVIASMALYLPYGMRYAYAGALQIHRELEEAASISGATTSQTFVRVVAPLLLPALISAWLLIFLLSVRAVSMPIMLVGPETQVVAVTLFDLWNNGQIPELAAMGLSWMAMMTVVSLALWLYMRRYGISFR